jgi:type VI secretion system protein ImpF
MARFESNSTVTQSLLDRLIDREPDNRADPPVSRAQSVRLLKASLRRDMEWLLNSRRIAEPAPEGFAEIGNSLYHYGLPDFSALTMASPRDRKYLLRELEASVAMFEPRLKDVRVTLVESAVPSARSLQFQIEGLLQMDPAPERISFDTVLQLTNGEYQIRGERSA